ncbi:MAG: hypothetical protein ACOYY3_18260 [Chloroflexota bacterium]
MKKLLELLSYLFCGIAAVVGLLAGGIVLVVYSLFNKIFGSQVA